MKTYFQTTIGICMLLLTVIALQSCECFNSDESLELVVIAGDRTRDCQKAFELRGSRDVTFICADEKVTVCWKSSGLLGGLTLSVGGTPQSVSLSGSQVISVSSDTDITISPPAGTKCASAKTFKVNVVTEPTPSVWQGSWTTDCSKIFFEVSDLFISKSLVSVDIMADWRPTIQISNQNGTFVKECETPPFLNGRMVQESFGFQIDEPTITESFSRPLKAIGRWEFEWKADCGERFVCQRMASLPFNMTLDCR